MTSLKQVRLVWISLVLLVGLVLGFFIVKPFLAEIFLASVLAVVAYPLHKKITGYVHQKTLASLISTLLVLLLVIVPLSSVGVLVVKEAVSFASSFNTEGSAVSDAVVRFDTFLSEHIPVYTAGTLSIDKTGVYIENGARWFANNIQGIFTNILDWVVSIAIMLVALYYLFKDGEKLYKGILYTSPLEDKIDSKIGTEVASIMRAVISGRIVVGLIQGFAAYIGFLFFGVSHAVLLATLVTIIAVLPLIGPLLVIAPVSLYIFAVGSPVAAVGLLLWGIFIVGLIDNIVGPILIHSRTNLHPFIVLISILGGIQLFGLVGFVAGPVVVGIVYALFRTLPIIYRATKA